MELGKRLNELVQTVQAFREKQKNERNKVGALNINHIFY